MNLESSFSEICFCSDEWRPCSQSWSIFNEFRHKGIFCDVALKVKDVTFPTHRLVLCACSDFFRSLFVIDGESNDKQEVEVTGVTPEIMATLLEFAYTGKVTISSRNVADLLSAADRFRVYYVKQKCCSYLRRHLSVENCIGIYKCGEAFYSDKLKCSAANFMLCNFEEISKLSEEFLHLSFVEMYRLIADDRLNVRGEEIVCESVYRWIEADKEARIRHLPHLLSQVRLGLLDPDFLMTKVNANEMVIDNMAQCQELLNLATRAVHKIPTPQSIDAYTKSEQLSRPRLPYDLLVAVGGWCNNGSTNAVEAYDPRAKSWSNISSIPGFAEDRPRAYHGVVFLNRCLYIIGGYDGVNYYDSVRKLNIITYEWIEEPSMFHKRCYVAVTKTEDKIYALGGMDGQDRLNTAEVYDPDRRAWAVLPPMHELRSDASAASLGNRIYVCGGFNGLDCLFTAEFYDPVNNAWTWITPMMTRRSGISIVALNDKIFAVGGFDGINRLRTAEAYDPSTNSWKMVEPMTKARSNFGMDVIEDQIIAVGGFNGSQTTSDVEIYDPSTDSWREAHKMQMLRSALSCCVMDHLPYIVVRSLCSSRNYDHELDEKDVSEYSLPLNPVQEEDETDV